MWFHKYPYPPSEGICLMTLHPSGNSNLASYIALKQCPPPSLEFPIPSVGGVWIFYGTTDFSVNGKYQMQETCGSDLVYMQIRAQCVVSVNIHIPHGGNWKLQRVGSKGPRNSGRRGVVSDNCISRW